MIALAVRSTNPHLITKLYSYLEAHKKRDKQFKETRNEGKHSNKWQKANKIKQ